MAGHDAAASPPPTQPLPPPVPVDDGPLKVPEAPRSKLVAPVSTVLPVPAAQAPLAASAATLAEAVVAFRKADSAVAGHLARARCPHWPVAAVAPPPCPSAVPAAMDEATIDHLQSMQTSVRAALAFVDADLPPLAPTDAEEGWQHVGRGHLSVQDAPREPSKDAPREPSKEALERSFAFKRRARGRCLCCLEAGHQVRACRGLFRCIHCRRPGHRERFCWTRSPAACACSSASRARSPITHGPCQRSCSPCVQSHQPPLARSWAEVVSHSSPRELLSPRFPSGSWKDPNASPCLDSALESQFAMLHTELLQLVVDRIEEVSRPLREEAAQIKQLLARVTSSLERADLCASFESTEQESSVVDDDDAVIEMESKADDRVIGNSQEESYVAEEECIFGCFSPLAKSCSSQRPDVSVASRSVDMAPVIQIMPELQELCGEPSPPLSLVHLQVDLPHVDSRGTSVVVPELQLQELCRESFTELPTKLGSLEVSAAAMTSSLPSCEPCQRPAFVDSGEVLTPNSEVLFGKEICDLLIGLEAAIPGYGKDIACVLTGKASDAMIKKVEKSLRSKRKKMIFVWKASAAV